MYIAIAVTTARRIHLFSSRTQKLSFATPKVLVGQLTGRIGSCRIQLRNTLVLMNKGVSFFIVIAREHSDRGNLEDWSVSAYASHSDLYCGDRHATAIRRLTLTRLKLTFKQLILNCNRLMNTFVK